MVCVLQAMKSWTVAPCYRVPGNCSCGSEHQCTHAQLNTFPSFPVYICGLVVVMLLFKNGSPDVISCIIVVFILTMLTASGKQAWLIADVIEIDFVLGSV